MIDKEKEHDDFENGSEDMELRSLRLQAEREMLREALNYEEEERRLFLCRSCSEPHEDECRCGWTPGLCLSCHTDEEVQGSHCATCIPNNNNGNEDIPF